MSDKSQASYFVYAECLAEGGIDPKVVGKPMLFYSGVMTVDEAIRTQDGFEAVRSGLAEHFGVADKSLVVIKTLTQLSNLAP